MVDACELFVVAEIDVSHKLDREIIPVHQEKKQERFEDFLSL